ncbi:MAG TPA: GIY-YIG nuclease family protein [Candidatus Paceibacterota bacterium]
MHYVYIIKSQKDYSVYVGSTSDLKRRIVDHNAGRSNYSSTKRPYVLVWYCAFPNKQKAVRFELYLKHGSGHAFAKRHLLVTP